MKAVDIRSLFLKYFEKNGHQIVESSSLVPQNDPTLLFTNAGMVQFKDVFLGKESRPYRRATTSQKCVRAGGKHNDLENVGFTARHHTFFEMLGNFSFGDYFKKEAIRLAWGFVTQELKMPKDKLYVTVFEKDDEAAEIWHQQEGVPQDHIFRFGEKDNFWSMGDTGPCGPCSEIFMDRGEKYSCKKPTCGMGCDCDRYMEFWNLVFMQYERSADGKLTPLPQPSVDTGAGLERIASLLQGVDTNYDTDAFLEIISQISRLSQASPTGVAYDQKQDTAVSFRVIADHSRATVFLIGDGVIPSNEGRGYVLRRMMRRAIRHGKKLGFTGPFLYQTVKFVISQMKGAYPDLVEKEAFIEKLVLSEEEQFLKTLERGLALLDDATSQLGQAKVLSGEVSFKLYDTYGFPLDLTRVICAEKDLAVDEVGFERAMERQRSESRKHWKGSGENLVKDQYLKLLQDLKAQGKLPRFVGYDHHQAQGECLAILEPQSSDQQGPLVEAVFSQTPFYGESGGQVGDHGRVTGSNFEGEVVDVQRPMPELIVAHIRPKRGTLAVGTSYLQETDIELRFRTARNHTATHLLHWALRKVLGNHVKQAGSWVGPDLLRFDFTHFQALTDEEMTQIEDLVNERVWNADPVLKQEMNKDQAIASGAMAFFGEKYGDTVRVVRVGAFSTELCGGTHVDNANEIHLIKIANESGIAAGVRRMVAYTSQGAFNYLREREKELKAVRDRLKASSTDEILGKLERMALLERDLRKQLEQWQAKSAGGEVDELLSKSESYQEMKWVISRCAPDSLGIKRLRDLADRIHQKAPEAIVVLGMVDPGQSQDDFKGGSKGESKVGPKASILVAIGPQAPKSMHANELLQSVVSCIEGRGGGKQDLAQAGGPRTSGLDEALDQARKWVVKKIGIG